MYKDKWRKYCVLTLVVKIKSSTIKPLIKLMMGLMDQLSNTYYPYQVAHKQNPPQQWRLSIQSFRDGWTHEESAQRALSCKQHEFQVELKMIVSHKNCLKVSKIQMKISLTLKVAGFCWCVHEYWRLRSPRIPVKHRIIQNSNRNRKDECKCIFGIFVLVMLNNLLKENDESVYLLQSCQYYLLKKFLEKLKWF